MASAQIRARITPRSGRNEITGMEEGVLRARVTAPPVEGAANQALIALLAEALGVPKSAIRITSGASSREKRLEIEGLDTQAVLQRLGHGD